MSVNQAPENVQVVVVISANAEWRAVRQYFLQHSPDMVYQQSPFGEWFQVTFPVHDRAEPVVFLHGGWGKIAAAASTQYVIDRWHPALLINLGTCGGFAGEIGQDTILLVERTLVYDILEQMGNPDDAIAHYATTIDMAWLTEPLPMPIQRALLVSADRDLVIDEIPHLKARYAAVAGDWESGAIAYVAARNQIPCLILRGVTDLVGSSGDETYGDWDLFAARCVTMMSRLIDSLPGWLASAKALL